MHGGANSQRADSSIYAVKMSNSECGEWEDVAMPITKDYVNWLAFGVTCSEPYVAYKFSDGTVWDRLVGWHKNEVAQSAAMRQFSTGATRNLDEHQLDYEAFLSPLVLEEYAKYMHGKRKQADGTMRDGDNWQKGIPFDSYMKSGFRHFMDWWKTHRSGYLNKERIALHKEILCAVMFNAMGYLHEVLKKEKELGE